MGSQNSVSPAMQTAAVNNVADLYALVKQKDKEYKPGRQVNPIFLWGYSPNHRIRSYVPYSASFPLPGRESSRFIPISFSSNISRRDSSLRRQGKGTAVGSRTTIVTYTRLCSRYRVRTGRLRKNNNATNGTEVPCYRIGTPSRSPDCLLTGTFMLL